MPQPWQAVAQRLSSIELYQCKEIDNFKFAELTQKSSKELFFLFMIVSLWYNRDIRIGILRTVKYF